MHSTLSAGFALAMSLPLAAAAAPVSEIDALRQEIAAIRDAYEARLQALEQRLKAAESSPAVAAPRAAVAASAGSASSDNPSASRSSSGANSFNPAMSLILSGLYASTSRDPSRYAIKGFALPEGAEVGPGTRGFSLAETELGLSASIDPWLRGSASIALHGDDSVSVEEAYVQTTALGSGFGLKAGRFFSGIGYLNAQHAHSWDFVDNPLAYQALLGTQYGDDGVQLTWLAPTDQYLELMAEIGRGRGFPGSDGARNGAGMRALALHTGGDIGTSHNWRAGVSVLQAEAANLGLVDTDAAGASTTRLFSGRSRVWIADAVWKWAPQGNASRTSFKLQGEYLRSTRKGGLLDDAGQDSDGAAQQSGWYVQGIYQFMPRWRAGLRTERLDAGNGLRPSKNTLMLDFNASEFSRVRLQLAQDRANFGAADRQVFLQYQMSLGAHGAHGY
ncbi:MAG: hypothetical protein V4792_04430 [Pseudomonadota bacterium]